MTTYTGFKVHRKGRFTLVTLATKFTILDRIHVDRGGSRFHLEADGFVMTDVAPEFHPMNPVREYRWRDVIGTFRLALEPDISDDGRSGDSRKRQHAQQQTYPEKTSRALHDFLLLSLLFTLWQPLQPSGAIATLS
jgi:hypothetical protein